MPPERSANQPYVRITGRRGSSRWCSVGRAAPCAPWLFVALVCSLRYFVVSSLLACSVFSKSDETWLVDRSRTTTMPYIPFDIVLCVGRASLALRGCLLSTIRSRALARHPGQERIGRRGLVAFCDLPTALTAVNERLIIEVVEIAVRVRRGYGTVVPLVCRNS